MCTISRGGALVHMGTATVYPGMVAIAGIWFGGCVDRDEFNAWNK